MTSVSVNTVRRRHSNSMATKKRKQREIKKRKKPATTVRSAPVNPGQIRRPTAEASAILAASGAATNDATLSPEGTDAHLTPPDRKSVV